MASTYVFNIGNFNCITFLDGTGPDMIRNMFKNIGEETLNQALIDAGMSIDEGEDNEEFFLNILYVDTGAHKVLIDTGMERGASERTGYLQDLMAEQGIEPKDIDTVIISHAHDDHINGLTDSEGRRVFKNARHVIWKDEWDYRMSQKEPPKKLLEVGDIEKIDTDQDIVPGIRALHAPGHTPGHMLLMIESMGERLLYMADLIVNRLQFTHPEICGAFVYNYDDAVHSRRRFLREAVDENLLVQTYHMPFPGLGHVARKGTGYEWIPITVEEGD